jgi:hypothetical protein
MIEDMTVRGFPRSPIDGTLGRDGDNEHTRRDYVRHVRAFATFIGRSPDTATAEDLRFFQLHQTQSGRHAAAEHQQRSLGPALLLHGDARPSGSGSFKGSFILVPHRLAPTRPE